MDSVFGHAANWCGGVAQIREAVATVHDFKKECEYESHYQKRPIKIGMVRGNI